MVHAIWLSRAKSDLLKPQAVKLTKAFIDMWKPKPKESWRDIDPYSDLEEINSSCEKVCASSDIGEGQHGSGYSLRKRFSKHRDSGWPKRKTANSICYREKYSDCCTITPQAYFQTKIQTIPQWPFWAKDSCTREVVCCTVDLTSNNTTKRIVSLWPQTQPGKFGT